MRDTIFSIILIFLSLLIFVFSYILSSNMVDEIEKIDQQYEQLKDEFNNDTLKKYASNEKLEACVITQTRIQNRNPNIIIDAECWRFV